MRTTTLPRSTTRGATRRRVLALALGGVVVATAACGGSSSGGEAAPAEGSDAPAQAAEPIDRLQLMAPADPGGGWDQSARAFAEAVEGSGAAGATQVSNVPGAGGTVGLADLATERSEEFLMVMGLVMVGAVETNQSQATLEDATPIARLTAEDLVLVVPADSDYQSVEDLVSDVEERGQEVAIAGGSAGGADHILAGLLLQAGDVPVENLNYVPYSGGGESLAALLGGQVAAGISGVGEYSEQIEAGALRALATSGAEPVDSLTDVPTLTDEGYDVELSNWRGVVAPPGISDSGRERLLGLVEEVHASEQWQEQLETRGWEDTYLPGEEFETFLGEEQTRVRGVLEDIGLVG
ncbi:Bug family tripartite tricarboxylate transporter substrate binding protein [Aquipuribacter hungaricus]|uniref:Bug family tripartite tricarboxylate transporter substrate binding protein n=1 Tax=Aquipuribacter hungaricus TaxID=545624 RepID=A0ABV7WB17_9MICO